MKVELSKECIQDIATLAMWYKDECKATLTPQMVVEAVLATEAARVSKGREFKRVKNTADAVYVIEYLLNRRDFLVKK